MATLSGNKTFRAFCASLLMVTAVLGGLAPAGTAQAEAQALTPEPAAVQSSADYTWDTVALGGGGYVTGMLLHPAEKDLAYIRTDVGGMYRWEPAESKWIRLLGHIPWSEWNLNGVESIAVDPSDPDVVYAALGKYNWQGPSDIVKSTDRGETWVRSNLSNGTGDVRMIGNGPDREAGERLAVDPNNGSTVYFASRYDGLLRSTSASAPGTWSPVGSFPAPAVTVDQPTGLTFVTFDPKTGVKGGTTQTLYVGAWGTGVYRSTDGGATWGLLEGSPLKPVRSALRADGVLFVTHTAGVAKFVPDAGGAGGVWSDVTPPAGAGKRFSGITLDAANPMVMMAAVNNGHSSPIYRSTDGGATWTDVKYWKDQSVPWAPGWHWSSATSTLLIDPFDSKRVWYTDWYNAWRTDDITASPSTWTSYPKGHEEVVTISNMTSPPSGSVILHSGVADVGGFDHTSVVAPPASTYYTAGGLQYTLSTGIDFQETNPNFVVRVGTNGWQGVGDGGYSLDQGQTYKKFTRPWSTVSGGRVAVSADKPHIVWLPRGFGSVPQVSADLGQTWTSAVGAPAGAAGGGTDIFKYKQPLASDRVNGSKFYLYSGGKFYRSEDSGYNWSQVYDSLPHKPESSTYNQNINIYAAPGMEGEVWVSMDKEGLFRTSDGGSTFTQVPGVNRAYLFAFGKNPPGAVNPAVFVYGTVNGEDGIFRSDDMGAHWIKVSVEDPFPSNDPNIMGADRQVFGRVYVGTNGSGIFYGEPAGSSAHADRTAPTAPTGLSVVKKTDIEAELGWTPSSDNVGVTAYYIYRGNSELAGIVAGSATSFKVTGLAANTAYTYVVKAKDEEGNFSAASTRLEFTTNKYPDMLIKNGGFESGITGWGTASADIEIVTSPVAEGMNALRLGAKKGNQQNISGFQASKAYTLSGWGKVSAPGQSATVQAWGSGVNKTLVFTSTEYEYKEIKFQTPADMSWLQVKLYNPGSSGSVWLDGLELKLAQTEAEPPTAPEQVRVIRMDDSTVTLEWDAASDNVGVEAYEVYRNGVWLGSTPDTTYAVSELTGNTPYSFTVRSKDPSWNLSEHSTPVHVITDPDGPPASKNSSFEAGMSNWSGGTIVGDPVHSGLKALKLGPKIGGQQGITTLKPNTAYKLSGWGKVSAAGTGGSISVQSGALNQGLSFTGTSYEYKSMIFTTPESVSWLGLKYYNGGPGDFYLDDLKLTLVDEAAPSAPASLAVEAGATHAKLVWTAASDNTGVTRYLVLQNGTEAGTATGTEYTVTGLAPGTAYTFQVKAADSSGNLSEASPEAIVTTMAEEVPADYAIGKVEVDGAGADAVWSAAAPLSVTHKNNGTVSSGEDLSAAYKMSWDRDAFYLLVDVTDDVLVNDSADPYRDDSVELYLDIGNDKAAGYGSDDYQYVFGWNDGTAVEYHHPNTSLQGVTFAQQKTESGYTMEIRLPWSALGGTPFAEPKMGIELQLNDDDDGGEREGKLAWWEWKEELAWQSPSKFGTALLRLPPDLIAPVTAVSVSPEGMNGWNTSDVTVMLLSVDNPEGTGVSGLSYRMEGAQPAEVTAVSGAEAVLTITQQGETVIHYAAKDVLGNAEEWKSVTIRLDRSLPELQFTGGGIYTLDQSVVIGCTASDTVSGVVYSTCSAPLVQAAAYELEPGLHTVTAVATDAAGQSVSGSVTYEVRADLDSLSRLVPLLLSDANEGTVNSLLVKLEAARHFADRGKGHTSSNQLQAFINHAASLAAEGKITPFTADILVKWARNLQ